MRTEPTFTMRRAMQRSRDAGSCGAASSPSRQKGKDPADEHGSWQSKSSEKTLQPSLDVSDVLVWLG